MSSIRPPVWPQSPSPAGNGARPAPDAAKLAAQRAFFQAALGGSAAPAAPTQTPVVATVRAAPAVHETMVRAQPEEPPARIPRPGSFLNILV